MISVCASQPSACCVEIRIRSISTGRCRPALVDLVANRHLRLAVGPQVGQLADLAHLRQPLGDLVREHDRQRHQLGGLVRRVAEHHSLVAGADEVERVVVGRVVLRLVRGVDALRDVGRLLVERDHDAAGVRVEAPLRVRVADLGDLLAHERGNVDVGLGRDLARHHDEAGRDQRLARDPAGRVVREHGVEHRVRDLIRDLVRVALGDRLRGEEEFSRRHIGGSGYLISRKASKVRVSPSELVQARRERSGLRFSVVELGRLWPARPAKPSSSGRASFRST